MHSLNIGEWFTKHKNESQHFSRTMAMKTLHDLLKEKRKMTHTHTHTHTNTDNPHDLIVIKSEFYVFSYKFNPLSRCT